MDFPIFHLDGIGNRLLIAIIAITHVLINHPLAVGAYPIITLLEWKGRLSGDGRWDTLAHRIVFVAFVITTTVGALSGVGIWLYTSLVSPFAIGSLLRVFFWGWFAEWLVFITEVVLILAYYLTWKKWIQGRLKSMHIALGATLSLFSWITMALIVAILAFMMDGGEWGKNGSFWSAFFNPLYLPQLAFRTCYAMVTGGLFAWFAIACFTRSDVDLRVQATRFVARWMLAWLPLAALAGLWYWSRVPAVMQGHTAVALLTQKFSQWQSGFLTLLAATLGLILILVLWGAAKPKAMPRLLLIPPFILAVALLGHFERVREFIRKPFVIADYMYSNGVRVDELPVFQRDGILPYAAYSRIRNAAGADPVEAGREVFLLTCSRCHTVTGVNSAVDKFGVLYGRDKAWDSDAIESFLRVMHNTRAFMPPFPGNADEAKALATFLKSMQFAPVPLQGAQTIGVP
jgi:mono/diheme cytochrome c family protein